MINYILHINGRGGSGKSTLMNALNEKLGLEKTSNYTTRKPRFEGESGYYFVTEEEFQERFRNNEIIECYFRRSNGAFYGLPSPTRTSIIQSEIMGLVALKKWCFQNGVPFLSVYLDVSPDILLGRLQRRADKNEDPMRRLSEDEYYEVFKNFSDITYEYADKSVSTAVDEIYNIMKYRGIEC